MISGSRLSSGGLPFGPLFWASVVLWCSGFVVGFARLTIGADIAIGFDGAFLPTSPTSLPSLARAVLSGSQEEAIFSEEQEEQASFLASKSAGQTGDRGVFLSETTNTSVEQVALPASVAGGPVAVPTSFLEVAGAGGPVYFALPTSSLEAGGGWSTPTSVNRTDTEVSRVEQADTTLLGLAYLLHFVKWYISVSHTFYKIYPFRLSFLFPPTFLYRSVFPNPLVRLPGSLFRFPLLID